MNEETYPARIQKMNEMMAAPLHDAIERQHRIFIIFMVVWGGTVLFNYYLFYINIMNRVEFIMITLMLVMTLMMLRR